MATLKRHYTATKPAQMAAMTTATNAPSVDLPAPPVKVDGRVDSAPDNPVLTPVFLVPVDVRAVEKLAVVLPAL